MEKENIQIKTAVLFSGGKDSCLALSYAMKYTQVVCLINIVSENPESYMFHTPNAEWTKLQAESIGIPLLTRKTKGIEGSELEDLEQAIRSAVENYHVEGIVSGAIDSAYQSSRIQKICDRLGLECFNPLWQKDQVELLEELFRNNFEAIIVGVFGEGLDGFLGKKIDGEFLQKASSLKQRGINPAGEGGEMESFVLDGPYFKKKLIIDESYVREDSAGGKTLFIEGMHSEKKEKTTHSKHINLPIISDNKGHNVLIINLNIHPLHDYEFIKPVVDIINRCTLNSRIIHCTEISKEILEKADKIIIAGTSLANMKYIEHAKNLRFIKEIQKPIFGICAGMQLISIIYGASLGDGQEIGLKECEFIGFLEMHGSKTIYTLHNKIIIPTQEFLDEFDICATDGAHNPRAIEAIKHKHKPIYATLFHPEVRNKGLIERFLY